MSDSLLDVIERKRQGLYFLTGTVVGVIGTWIKFGIGDALMLFGFLLIIVSLLETPEVEADE